MEFEVVDVSKPLPFDPSEFDITLCLYTVLNHVRPEDIQPAVEEIHRVTKDVSFVTVRARGGLDTVYACKLGDVADWLQDEHWLRVRDKDGECFAVRSTLFTVPELRSLYTHVCTSMSLVALDLFSSRYEQSAKRLAEHERHELVAALRCLESQCERHEVLMNAANHIGIVSY
jgi:hypothetical protein